MNTPAPPPTCDVFISYASQDADQVIAIAQLLETAGVSVWRDGDRILGGQYYGEQIVHALAQSPVVLLMCSPKSLISDNVHREVLLAWEWGARHYVPVWISPPADIPERFRYCLVGCQWIDAHAETSDQWLPRLLSALESYGVHAATSTEARDTAEPSPSTGRASETAGRTTRFQSGDRPIPGADWELLMLLGKGGFGEVWKAHNPQLANQPPVALKFCLRLDERGRDLLRHEADMVLRVQQQLKSERVVPLLHAYLNNDPPCLEYPYVEGGTLVQFIEHARQAGVNLAPNQIEVVIRSIAKVVGAAHRATPKLVHRDLKPANVLVERRPDGKRLLRVTDFGIGAIISQPLLEQARTSSSLQANMASVLTGAYTPLYASPQQIRGDKPDPRDDVYSLGVIWYQLLTSDLTSPAPTGRMWSEPLRRGGMSDAAIDLLASCLESDPAYRPSDAGVLAERLMGLVQSGATKRDSFDELPFVVPIDQPVRTERPPPAAKKSQSPPPTRKGRAAAPTVGSAYPLPELNGREPQRHRMPRPSRRLWSIFAGIAALVLLCTFVALWAGGVFNLERKDQSPPDKGDGKQSAENAKDSLDQWFAVGTRWEGKQVVTEPNPYEATIWFIVNSCEGNRFRGRAVNESRSDLTVEGVLNDDRSSFTWKIVDHAVNEWVPDRAPIESIEASGQWKDGRVRIDWEWPRPDGKVRRGFWEFTAKKVISKPGESDRWPPSLNPGKANCGPTGTWRVQGGELVQEDVVEDWKSPPFLNWGDLSWVEYDFRIKAMKTKGDNGFRVVFDIPRSSKLTQWCIGVDRNGQSVVETAEFLPSGIRYTRRTEVIPVTVKDNQWYEILIKARGKQIECFLDGNRKFQFTDPDRRGGRVGITCMRMAARFKDIEIKAPDGTVLWKGPPKLP